MQTVRDILEAGDYTEVHMMTPDGYVDLTGEQAKEVLAGKTAKSNLGCKAYESVVKSEDLLKQIVISTPNKEKNGSIYLITDWRK